MAVPRAREVAVEAHSISRLSIVIPSYGDMAQVAELLQVLQPLRSLGVELLVANGLAADAERAAGLISLTDHIVQSPSGRARQMNAAAKQANGEFLLFLHADSKVETSLFTPFLAVEPVTSDWGFYRLQIEPAFGLMPVVTTFINWRSVLTQIATGDQALWVRRSLFEQLGGYADQRLMEDIELCSQLRKAHSPSHFAGYVITSARRWQNNGQIKTILTMWWLRLRYWFGANPDSLAALYYPHHKRDSP